MMNQCFTFIIAIFFYVVIKVLSNDSIENGPKINNASDSNNTSEKNKGLDDAIDRIVELEKRLQAIEYRVPKKYPDVKFLSYKDRKRILITGGAGFIGSHLVDRLMTDGHEVIVVDNYFTGRKRNVEKWIGHENFELIDHDIVNPLYYEVNETYHLASPESPTHYLYNPVKTIKTNIIGTINCLDLVKRVKARILIASTSEVYGDPEEYPQSETYWGHVNPIGSKACYKESKRVSETLAYSYAENKKVEVRVARISNTYGPRMDRNDGNVISKFIIQSLTGNYIKIDNGNQIRSFLYVSDLVDGLIKLMNSNTSHPVNLGNPKEHTIGNVAHIIHRMVGGANKIIKGDAVNDNDQRYIPEITRAKDILNWEPVVSLEEGIKKTIEYFHGELTKSKPSEKN